MTNAIRRTSSAWLSAIMALVLVVGLHEPRARKPDGGQHKLSST